MVVREGQTEERLYPIKVVILPKFTFQGDDYE